MPATVIKYYQQLLTVQRQEIILSLLIPLVKVAASNGIIINSLTELFICFIYGYSLHIHIFITCLNI